MKFDPTIHLLWTIGQLNRYIKSKNKNLQIPEAFLNGKMIMCFYAGDSGTVDK